MLFGRIDYQDKNKRLREQNMEFIWKSSPSLGKKISLKAKIIIEKFNFTILNERFNIVGL